MEKTWREDWSNYSRPENKSFESAVNDELLILWEKGKKILNTKNTNYSYGGLEDVLNQGLYFVPIGEVKSVLVLGMGAGCVVESLRNKYNYQGPITGVELDPVVIQIANDEFDLQKDQLVEVIQADAAEYIAHSTRKFDLVIVDLFIDLKVPEQFYGKGFWQNVESRVNDNKFVLFNAGINLDHAEIKKILSNVPTSFEHQIRAKLSFTNTVINFRKNRSDFFDLF
ncbi:MAG TPA: fused MFS/spermidine synthase [Flavobacteriaceae bacterium]|nr:fused MFS/spermidine synthase [Flavobacteriaceae bacterium]